MQFAQVVLAFLLDVGDAGQVVARDASGVEGTHRQLRSRLADGLRRDDARRHADVHQPSGRQVAAVALGADALAQFAGQHRAHLHRDRRRDVVHCVAAAFLRSRFARRTPRASSSSVSLTVNASPFCFTTSPVSIIDESSVAMRKSSSSRACGSRMSVDAGHDHFARDRVDDILGRDTGPSRAR